MLQLVLIAAGGAIGALLRFWMSSGVHALFGRSFPYGTLTVNVCGSLLMGLFYIIMLERTQLGPEWRAGLLVGLLGAFTTFSTFSIETMNLVEAGELGKAGLNAVLSVVLCVGGCWLGMLMGRQL